MRMSPPPTHRHVQLTRSERRLRALLAAAVRRNDPAADRLRLEYELAVARRRADEYARRVVLLEAKLSLLTEKR